jgi:hypothetical protein
MVIHVRDGKGCGHDLLLLVGPTSTSVLGLNDGICNKPVIAPAAGSMAVPTLGTTASDAFKTIILEALLHNAVGSQCLFPFWATPSM